MTGQSKLEKGAESYSVVVETKILTELYTSGWKVKFEPNIKKAVFDILNNDLGVAEGESEIRIKPALIDKIGQVIRPKKTVVVVGAFKKGKTHLITCLSHDKSLPNGQTHSTEGLSCLLSLNDVMFIDTQGGGTNVSEDERTHFIVALAPEFVLPKLTPEIEENEKLFSEHMIKCIKIAAQHAEKASKQATINHRAQETFLNDVASDLGDLVIVMVEKMNDQEHGFAMSHLNNLEYFNRLQANLGESYRKNMQLVVVHNFSNCDKAEEMVGMQQKWIYTKFPGTTEQKEVQVKGNNSQCICIPVHTSFDSKVLHLSLGKDGTPAGSLNEATLQFIRNIIDNYVPMKQPEPIMYKLCKVIKDRMSKYFPSMSEDKAEVYLVKRGDDLYFKTNEPLKWCDENAEFKDYMLQVTRPNVYNVPVSAYFTTADDGSRTGFVIVADVPGMCSKKIPRHSSMESYVTAYLDDNKLIIKGTRALSYFVRGINDVNTSSAVLLSNVGRDNLVYKEQTYGNFRREITLPKGVKKSTAKTILEDGVFQVSFLMETESVQDLEI